MDKVQNTVSGLKAETFDLVDQIKNGKLPNEKQVRFINLLIFAKLSFILLVIPSIYRYFVIGSPGESDLANSTLEFLRLAGVFAFGLFFVANIARRHTDQSVVTKLQTDIFKLFTWVFTLLTLTSVYFYFQGGTIFYALWAVFYILFAVLNAKSAKLFLICTPMNKVYKKRRRTDDVMEENEIEFSSLFIKSSIIKALNESGYFNPSPVQKKVIPIVKEGLDCIGKFNFCDSFSIVQAKSGTGKTIVMSILSLEKITATNLQVLIIAPTREIAIQIQQVSKELSIYMENTISIEYFVGGFPVHEGIENFSENLDIEKLKNCQIAIGTPGRITQLLASKYMKTKDIKLLILDEADVLFQEQFEIKSIIEFLPNEKQFCAFSATFSKDLLTTLNSFMKNSKYIQITKEVSLKGVKEYYIQTNSGINEAVEFQFKKEKVIEVLKKVTFHQCIIFCHNSSHCESLSSYLNENGFSSDSISSSLSQKERLNSMNNIRNFKSRILVSTDLTSRGVDFSRINVVINLSLPNESETYMHRIGRTGRFGTFGIAISILTNKELNNLMDLREKLTTNEIEQLPNRLDPLDYTDELNDEEEQKLKSFQTTEREIQSSIPEKPEEKLKKQKIVSEEEEMTQRRILKKFSNFRSYISHYRGSYY
eukprot:gene3063-5233_t